MVMMEVVILCRTSNLTIKGAADSYDIIINFADDDVKRNWVEVFGCRRVCSFNLPIQMVDF